MEKMIWPKVGHQKQVEQLEEDIRRGRVAQGYLFVGPEKIGKMTVAKAFVKNLQTWGLGEDEGRVVEHQIEKEGHKDSFFWRDDGGGLKVEEVRKMIRDLGLSLESNYRIWVVQRAGRFSLGAANALLKTLEEPNERVVFIFTVEHREDLPETVVSRMRVINFQNVGWERLKEDLRRRHPEESEVKIEEAMKYALGKPGRAERLLADPREFEREKEEYEMIEGLLFEMGVFERFKLVEEVVGREKKEGGGGEIEHFLERVVNVARGRMLDEEEQEEERIRMGEVIERVYRARRDIGINVNKRIVLEELVLNF